MFTFKRTNFLIETICLIAAIIVAGVLLRPEDPCWTHIPASPFWLVTLMIPLRYGSPAGLIAGGACALVHLAAYGEFSFSILQENVFLSPSSLLLPAGFLITGHFVGESVHAGQMRTEHLRSEMSRLQADKEALSSEFASLEQAYRQVEGQVAGESDSLYTLLRSVTAFDAAEPHNIPKVIDTLLHRFLKSGTFAYWQLRDGGCRQVYPLDRQMIMPALGRIALEQGRIVTAREFPAESAQEGFDIAGAFRLGEDDSGEAHVLAAGEIAFPSWHSRLDRIFAAILREVRHAQARHEQNDALERKLPFEKKLRLAGETFLRQHVYNAVLLQQRNNGVSSLVFLHPCPPHNHDQRLLTIIASALRCLLRNSDTKAYLRESEFFAIFLPDTALTGAQMATEKLRAMLYRLDLSIDGKPVQFCFCLREIRTTDELQKIMQELQEGKVL